MNEFEICAEICRIISSYYKRDFKRFSVNNIVNDLNSKMIVVKSNEIATAFNLLIDLKLLRVHTEDGLMYFTFVNN